MRFLTRQVDGTESELDLAMLVEQIQNGTFTRESMVYDTSRKQWRRADTIDILDRAFEAADELQGSLLTPEPVTPQTFIALIAKLAIAAVAIIIPIAIIGGTLLLLTALADADLSVLGDSAPFGVTAIILLAVAPYLSSLLLRRLDTNAYARTYNQALKRAGRQAAPVKTAIAALAIHRSRRQLITSIVLLTAAVLYTYLWRASIADARAVVFGVAAAITLLVLRGYIFEWRIAKGLYATNAYEARELIEFLLRNRQKSQISGLGARDFELIASDFGFETEFTTEVVPR